MPDAVYSGWVGLQAAHHSGAGPEGPGRRSSAVAVGGDGGAFSSGGRFRGSGAAPHFARARMEERAWFGAG